MASQASPNWVLGPNTGLNQRGFALDSQQAVLEADNLGYLSDAFCSMRNAFTDEDLTGSGFTGEIQWLARHVTDDGVEEIWAAADNSGTVACARYVTGAWSAVTLIDTPNPDSLAQMHSVSFNGKLYLAYDSAVNRLHVWDGTAVRRVGLIVSGVGAAANTGAGAYAATARQYRFSQRIKDGSDIVAESELSAAISFTPSGAGTAVRITQPAAVDSATHWVVYGLISTSGDTYDLYEEIAEVINATTTFDDSVNPASYSGDAPPELNSNIPPPSAKFLVTDASRVIMAGAWESAAAAGQTDPQSNRIWFTRAIAATDVGDDEAVPNELWLDIGDAGPITGLGSTYNDIYAFKVGSVHKLIPTQDPDGPFSRGLISENFGAVGQRCICSGETEDGFGALFFADDHAVYRLAYGAVLPYSEPISRDLRAQPLTVDGSLLAFDPYRRVLLLQVSNSGTDIIGSYSAFMADTAKKRWSGFSLAGQTGGWTLGASVLGSSTILAGSNATIRAAVVCFGADNAQRLYVGGGDNGGASLLRSWGVRNVIDGDVAFTARTRARRTFGPGKTASSAGYPVIYYRNPSGATAAVTNCTVSLIKNYDEETISESFEMEATQDDNGISVKTHKFESVFTGEAGVLDCVVSMTGSGTAWNSVVTPTIDAIVVPLKVQDRI